MDKTHYEAIRNQVYMLERAARAVRAQFEQLLLDADASATGRFPQPALDCPLTALLNGVRPISRRQYPPYEGIVEGVHVAYPATANTLELAAEVRSFQVEPGPGSGGSCLLLHVRRLPGAGSAWATLETQLDAGALLALDALALRLILGFQSRAWPPLGSYRVFLRIFTEKGFQDFGARSFPALNVPIELTYAIPAEEFAAIPRAGVTGARIVIGLPLPEEADYTALLSHFEFCSV